MGALGREWALLAGRDLQAVFSGKPEEIRRLNCRERFSYSPKGSVLLVVKAVSALFPDSFTLPLPS